MTKILYDYDLFISHASEDKDFVRPLVEQLERLGLNVWYDETALKIGDSLSSSIDKGLASAKYGVIILSANFFNKNWPKYELSGLKARQINGEQVILPIWHNVTLREILSFSPPLADMLAFDSGKLSLEEMAETLFQTVNSENYSRWFIQTSRKAAQNLDKTQYNGAMFDYWPDGGMRNVYDHLLTFGTYAQLSKHFGGKIFLSGPHSETRLDLNNNYTFGHYNPEFIKWLKSNISFILANPSFVRLTTPLVEKYLGKQLMLYYQSYEYLYHNPKMQEIIKEHYLEAMKSTQIESQHYNTLSYIFLRGEKNNPIFIMMSRLRLIIGGHAAASACYFWIRRIIDGTSKDFFGLLLEVFKAYCFVDYANSNFLTNWNIEE